MPVYEFGGKQYNIPSEKVADFEKNRPEAKKVYNVQGDIIAIPLSRVERVSQIGKEVTADEYSAHKKHREAHPLTDEEVAKAKERVNTYLNYVPGNAITPENKAVEGYNAYGLPTPSVKVEEKVSAATPMPMMTSEAVADKDVKGRPLPAVKPLNEQEKADRDLTVALSDAEDSYNKVYAAALAEEKAKEPTWRSLAIDEVRGVADAGIESTVAKRPEVNTAYATWKLLDDADKMRTQANRNEAGASFFKNVLYGIKDNVFDPQMWDFGVKEAGMNVAIQHAAEKDEKGIALTEGEQKLLDAAIINMVTQMSYADRVGAGYKAGAVTAESIPFMVEMMVNPMSGAGKTLARSVAKAALKKYAKGGLGNLVKKIMRDGGKTLAGKVARGAVDTAGNALGAAGMAMTTGVPGVIADASRRINDGESKGAAFAKALGARVIENFGEQLGGQMAGVGGAIGKGVNKMTPKWVSSRLQKMSSNAVVDGISNIVKKGGWNGLPEEYLEEVAGTVLNSIFIGDSKLSDLTDVEKQVETFLRVSILGGAIATAKTAGYGVSVGSSVIERRKAKAQLNNAEQALNSLMTDEVAGVKAQIDNADVGDIEQAVMAAITNPAVNAEQKIALISYAGAVAKMKTMATEREKQRAEGTRTVQKDLMEDAYTQGMDAVGTEKRAIEQEYQKTITELGLTDEEVSELEEVEDTAAYIAEHADKEDMLNVYFTARAKRDGMIHEAEQRIQQAGEEARKSVEAIQHEDGNVYDAELTGGTPVTISTGEVVIDEDGDIDKAASAKRFIVKGIDGSVQMVGIDEIAHITNARDAEEEKAAREAQAIEQATKKEENEIDPITIPIGTTGVAAIDGVEANVTVVGEVDADGNIPVDIYDESGNVVGMRAIPAESITPNESVQPTAQQVETPQEPTSQVAPQQEEAQKPAIPTDENGKKVYEDAPVEETINSLTAELGADGAADVVSTMITNIAAKIEKEQNTTSTDVNDIIAKKHRVAELQRKAAYWAEVQNAMAAPVVEMPIAETTEEVAGETVMEEEQPAEPVVEEETETEAAEDTVAAEPEAVVTENEQPIEDEGAEVQEETPVAEREESQPAEQNEPEAAEQQVPVDVESADVAETENAEASEAESTVENETEDTATEEAEAEETAIDELDYVLRGAEQAFDEIQKTQGEIKPTAKKRKGNIWIFTGKEKERPVLMGVYHDPDGHAVASSSYVLLADKEAYSAENSGKVVDKNGNEVQGNFPRWQNVVPKEGLVDTGWGITSITEWIEGVKEAIKEKKLSKREVENTRVLLRTSGGKLISMKYDILYKFIDGVNQIGAKEILYAGLSSNPMLVAKNARGVVLAMPMPVIDDYNATVAAHSYAYDGKVKPKKTKPKSKGKANKPAKGNKAEKIEDVGEKIGGAKKDLFAESVRKMKEDAALSDEDMMERIASQPISKIFNFDLAKLREGGMTNEQISFIAAAKKVVPAKPRKTSKVRRWVNAVVQIYRTCLEAGTNWEYVGTWLKDHPDNELTQIYDAYMAVGGYDSGLNIGEARLRQLGAESYRFEGGERVSLAGQWYVAGAGRHGGIYKTREEAVEALKAFAGENALPKDKKPVKFVVYMDRKNRMFFITPEGKSGIVLQTGFKSSKEAFDYIKEHQVEMQERYMALREDSKGTFKENRERKGRDYLAGENIQAEDFRQTFGFRGVEFGNWMTTEGRQKALNECYNALMDLASVLNVSPKALSLGGTLAMAFGARGGGKFSAHYEPTRVVINLTKTKGAGSLAHEWWHALDHYFAMMGGLQYGFATHKEGLRPDVISYGRTGNEKYYDRSTGKQISKEEYDERVQNHGVRQEMAEAWESLMDKLNKSDYATRSRAYDDLHNGSYWSKGTEMGARAFAVWVENKLSEQNAHNDYLANNPHLTKEQIEQSSLLAGVFPYPFDEDAEWMNEGFGNLFEVMQEKVEENNAVLYQVANEVLSNTTEAQKLATEAVLAALGKAGVEVIEATPEMVDAIMNESGAEMQVLNGKLSALEKAAKTIKMWVERGVRGKSFILSLPLKTQNMVRVAMGRDFDTHNITANGISHALKNHGENGIKLKGNSIPIKKEDTTLIPYIMTAPDRVEKGSTDASGRESIRFYKDLSNGYVVVVEKEYKNSPDDMETINIWAEMSSKATNAQRVAAPDIDVQNAILSTDVAKIREDAEKAIREDVKRNAKTPQFHRVYHGSGTLFDEFDHSFIGTGEGHQAFGWGTYVTEVQSIGESYANKLSKPVFLYKGERVDTESFSSPYRVMADLYHATNGKLTEMRAMAKKYASSSREFGSEAADLWDDVLSILNETRRGDIKISKGKVLYTVEIPNDIDGNYIEYDASVGEGTVEKVGAEMESKYGFKFSHKMEGNGAMVYEKDGEKVVLNPKASGADLYEELSDALGGAKEASSFLSEVGFTGISYQAEHLSGGRADGAKNYVIFNEKDLQIKDVVEMMRTPQGTVYGWTVGGKIYLTPAGMNANTPIHEYTHLWANAMMQKNPRGWESVKNLLKGTPVWDAVIKDEAYADIRSNEDLVASEVLSRISGRENARKMEAEAQKMIDEANGVVGKANAVTLLSRMKEALQKFWNWVGKDLFGIESFDSIEEVTDRVLYDLVSGTDLKRGVAAEENVLYRTSTEIDEQYPNWLEGTTTDSGKHSTQVEGTRKTYNKVGDWIEGNMGKEVSILDASSGLGYGTMDLRERGFNIEDVEPYQSEQRKQENPATYSSYGDIEKQYDVIISNAVLNVIPDDWRANVLHDMADRLKAGGMMFINTRKAGEEKNIKDKIELDNSREVLVKRNGKIASYQKFFTPTELKEWVENELGAGYTVAIANEANSGTKGLAAVVVYKTDSKRYREWTDEQRAEYSAQKGIVEEVERVAATMGEAVEFVTAEQMPKGKEKAKGYYNPRTGKVVINVSAHTSSWDACRTAFHEIVGHKGLRAMLKGGFNDFLDSVYKGMGWRVRSGIDREAAKYIAKGESETEARRHATEEYVARMAEEGFVPRNRSVWNKIADALKYALMNAKIRLGFSLSDRDVRYALWRTYDMLTHKGVIGQARDIAMREKEGIGVAEDQNRYRDVDDVVDRTLNAWYDNEVKSFGHKLREGYQDGMLALKKVQEQIAKQTGRPLADYEDAYTAENQATSISKEEQFWYTERYFKPMMNAVTSLMSAANMTYDEVVKYVLAKSGIERNSTLAWRDTIDAYAEKLAEDGATPEEINEKVADAIKREAEAVEAIRVAMGGKRDAEYYKKVDKARADIIPEYKDYRKNDYAGLTSLMETQGEKSAAKKAEAKAMDVVNAVEGRCVDECNTLWESIKEATRATLRKSYVSGMMSQEQYNKVLQMFEFYVL